MPQFNYSARQANGQIQKGVVTAQTRSAAIASLRLKHLQPVTMKETKGGGSGFNMNINLPGSNKVKAKDLVMFTRQFATMVNAGVPILRSLTLLKDQTRSLPLKKALESITADIQGGSNLSDALGKHPNAFQPIYVNMVRAGEAGGILDQVLGRLAFQQEKDSALKSKIKAAMVYPCVIGTVVILAFFVLMTFIVPKIGTILTSLSGGTGKLPIYTRVLLSLSHTMKSPVFIVIVIAAIALISFLFKRWTGTEKGRYQWHYFLLKIPVISVIITKTAIARFARIFASLMGAGVSIVEAIDTTADAIGNAVIEKELRDCSKAIQAGSQLSTEIQKSKHFPPIVAQMLAVGEETGQTDTVIIKVAEFYEEEVDAAVGALSSIIEPVMILVLGAMVGLIAISVFGPITQLSTATGN
jgi:type IV pilus assembly protein PilC